MTLAGALTLAGYEVICFADGAGLLARARIRIPLCVFLDVGVRDKCRFDLLDRICAEHWRAPVFASSAEASIPLAVLSVYPSTPVSWPANSARGSSRDERCGVSDAGALRYEFR